MKVIALQNVKMLGTSLQLTAGNIYEAIPATNLPEPGKVFVYPTAQDKETGDSIALTLGDEVEVVNEIINTVPSSWLTVGFVTDEVADYARDVLPPCNRGYSQRGCVKLNWFALGEIANHTNSGIPGYQFFVRACAVADPQGKHFWFTIKATNDDMIKLVEYPEHYGFELLADIKKLEAMVR